MTKTRRQQPEPRRQPRRAASRDAALRRLADALPQLLWVARADGYMEYYNQSCYDYTGKSREELLGWGWQHVLHPDELEVKLQRWAESLRSGNAFEIEYRIRRFDGSFRWHLGRALPFRDENGEIVSWFGTSTNIEAQKQAEQALRETQAALEQRVAERTAELVEQSDILQSILTNMGDAVIVADRQERFLLFNPAAQRMFGAGAASAPSATWPDLYGL